MKTRGPKARGYDVHKKEAHPPLSFERKHRKPVPEDKKHLKMAKTGDMIFMDSQ
jgi:hypothetical protein